MSYARYQDVLRHGDVVVHYAADSDRYTVFVDGVDMGAISSRLVLKASMGGDEYAVSEKIGNCVDLKRLRDRYDQRPRPRVSIGTRGHRMRVKARKR
jgi:hypothetical protein